MTKAKSEEWLSSALLAEALTSVEREFPDIRTELVYETPFQLLVAVILSAQTTDRQVNRVTPPLFARMKTARDAVGLGREEIERSVASVNFYRNKAKYIYESAVRLDAEFGGTIPNDLAVLTTLPGVGIKTAKVVLTVLYDAPYVGVDTHVHRVSNRIGLVATKTPEQTDRALDALLSEEQKRTAHHPLVLFGRYRCTARAPKCGDCSLRRLCRYYREHLSHDDTRP